MDILSQSINRLTESEHVLFRATLRIERKTSKELRLYDAIREEKSKSDIQVELFGRDNANAYHQVRARLLEKVGAFLAGEHLKNQPDEISVLRRRFWFICELTARGCSEAASRLMHRTLSRVKELDDPELLDELLRFAMAHASELGLNAEELLASWGVNKQRLGQHEELEVARILVTNRVRESRLQGKTVSLSQVISDVRKAITLNTRTANDVRFMYNLVELVRRAVVSSKSYHLFERFVLRLYNGFLRNNAFGHRFIREEAGFLYMISHVLYRNRKLNDSLIWLDKLAEVLERKGAPVNQLHARTILLRAQVMSYLGRNKDAIDLLIAALGPGAPPVPTPQRMDMQLNLAVYHFQAADYRKSIQVLSRISDSERRLEQLMGMEWAFKKNLIEAIAFIENGDPDLAIGRLRYIEQHFSTLLSQPAYRRALVFISFIRQVIMDPQVLRDPVFAERLESANLGLPTNQEDIQAITFFCWLKSKLERRAYYEVLLDTVNPGHRQREERSTG